jgi:CRISPR type I-D-associated protein Csc1
MKIFAVKLFLLDAVYYAREGLSAAVTPPVLHGTALNGAMASATNEATELQPFLICEANGGANKPRYTNSRLSEKFYATPGRPVGNVQYRVEIAKGDAEGFIEILLRKKKEGLARIDSREQPLKFRRLHLLAPDSEFLAFLIIADESWTPPELIRLGSFRAPARVEYIEASSWKTLDVSALADHPVDPLVSHVSRGVVVNMHPYGVVENAVAKPAVELRFQSRLGGLGKSRAILAWPAGYDLPLPIERTREGMGTIFV